VALLGRYPEGTLNTHPTLPTDERIIVIRFDGQLYFANVSYFEDTILAAVAKSAPEPSAALGAAAMAASSPRSRSIGAGGQPGIFTSTGMTFSTAPQLA
jgi:hypothetical protein